MSDVLDNMTHSELVKKSASWLKRQGFPVVATELKCTANKEQPDVIGFRSSCCAIIEVKVSRSDFLSDKNKTFRLAGSGLGLYRFYLAPVGVIEQYDLPEGWGLLTAKSNRIERTVAPRGNWWPSRSVLDMCRYSGTVGQWGRFMHSNDEDAERAALYSIARRLSYGQSNH